MSHPGATSTTSPARSTCSTRSTTPSPSPATATAPRRPSSLSAFRRPADIRESSKFDTTPKIRRTIDSHHHGGPLAARAFDNSSMRRRMAASLNRPTAWRRRGLARTAFPGAEELAADGPWVGCGSATRAGSRGCRCARGAAAARSSCHCPVLLNQLEIVHQVVHRCASFRPDALRRAPGAVPPAAAPYRNDERRAPKVQRPENGETAQTPTAARAVPRNRAPLAAIAADFRDFWTVRRRSAPPSRRARRRRRARPGTGATTCRGPPRSPARRNAGKSASASKSVASSKPGPRAPGRTLW